MELTSKRRAPDWGMDGLGEPRISGSAVYKAGSKRSERVECRECQVRYLCTAVQDHFIVTDDIEILHKPFIFKPNNSMHLAIISTTNARMGIYEKA